MQGFFFLFVYLLCILFTPLSMCVFVGFLRIFKVHYIEKGRESLAISAASIFLSVLLSFLFLSL